MSSPPPYPCDRETLERVCELTPLRRGGPGGQHQNRRETAIRITHPPSGTTLVVNEHRSQHRNREEAFERLAARLAALNRPRKKRKRTRVPRRAKRERLREKRRRAEKKRLRRKDHDP